MPAKAADAEQSVLHVTVTYHDSEPHQWGWHVEGSNLTGSGNASREGRTAQGLASIVDAVETLGRNGQRRLHIHGVSPELAELLVAPERSPRRLRRAAKRARRALNTLSLCAISNEATSSSSKRTSRRRQSLRRPVIKWHTVATDGSSDRVAGIGAAAWVGQGGFQGAVVLHDRPTSVEAEVAAVAGCLTALPGTGGVKLLIDYRPLAEAVTAITRGHRPQWARGADWDTIVAAVATRTVRASWVKAHADCKANRRVDLLARRTMRNARAQLLLAG